MYTHQKLKTASDVGKRARGGTRTGFYPLQTLGTPENVANPAQSGRCTTRSEAQGVHIVHTPLLPCGSNAERDKDTLQHRPTPAAIPG
jgi:hypothetical protein